MTDSHNNHLLKCKERILVGPENSKTNPCPRIMVLITGHTSSFCSLVQTVPLFFFETSVTCSSEAHDCNSGENINHMDRKDHHIILLPHSHPHPATVPVEK